MKIRRILLAAAALSMFAAPLAGQSTQDIMNLIDGMRESIQQHQELTQRAANGDREAAAEVERQYQRDRAFIDWATIMIDGTNTSNRIRESVQRQQQAIQARNTASHHRVMADHYARSGNLALANWHTSQAVEYARWEQRLLGDQ
jgi:gas vesicle protein